MVESFSAIGVMFAGYLTEHFLTAGKEPPALGMIQATYAGSSIEPWMKVGDGKGWFMYVAKKHSTHSFG